MRRMAVAALWGLVTVVATIAVTALLVTRAAMPEADRNAVIIGTAAIAVFCAAVVVVATWRRT